MRNTEQFCIARAHVAFPLGVATIVSQDGGFAGIIDTATGDTTLQLQPDNGLDLARTQVSIVANKLILAGSDAPAFALDFPTAFDIRVTSVQEQAAGAASILTDIEFFIAVYQFPAAL
jgi:hypothetical protein